MWVTYTVKDVLLVFKLFFLIGFVVLISSCNKSSKSTSDTDTGQNSSDSDQISKGTDQIVADVCGDQSTCQNGDGCCPDGCTLENDDDCACGYTMDITTPQAVFRATFESGTITPDVSVGTSPELVASKDGGDMVAVENPAADFCNPSSYVLKATVPAGYTRAEYQSPRFPTLNHGYIYTWREFIPLNFFDDMSLDWLTRAQWKTWPCGTGQTIDVSDQVCEGGGIFNDFGIDAHLGSFRFRAVPDCHNVHVATHDYLGKWSTYVIEIYWTQSNDGYYRVFQNGQLLVEESGIKTLFDGFVEGDCDMYFAGGLYNSWASDERELLTAYFDDYAIFDMDAGIALGDVCPTCAEQLDAGTSGACSLDNILPTVDDELVISRFENSCEWNVGALDFKETVEGKSSLRWDHQLTTRLEMTYPDNTSVLDFSNGGSTADSLSFWVYNNIEEPDNSMVLLMYSENDSTDGTDYYYVRVTFDFTGWKQIVVPRDEISVSRTPSGWDQITSVMFVISGWDCTPNPQRVVYLDDMKFTNTP
ncbi:MAG: heparin lyase I family protein [Deltaproteobacteria bacterium]|nr:heparin lyase I family protein [Deltaproteobacteria bacterium]